MWELLSSPADSEGSLGTLTVCTVQGPSWAYVHCLRAGAQGTVPDFKYLLAEGRSPGSCTVLSLHGMSVTVPLGKEGKLRGENKLWARV